VSKLGNKYAQIFASRFGWYWAYPIKGKPDAHLGLFTLFARDGAPNVMVMDNAREQIQEGTSEGSVAKQAAM
jgi:hypothetical protein